MRRLSSALIQAVECVTIVLVGVALGFGPALIGMLISQGPEIDLIASWRLGVDAWMLGHGVDIGITLPAEAVIAAGVEAAAAPFVLSIAAPGFALLTVVLAFRSGTRLGNAPSSIAAVAGAVVATAGLSVLLALSAQSTIAAPNIAHAAVFPALIMLVGLGAGFAWHWLDAAEILSGWFAIGAHAAHLVRIALQVGFGAIVALLGVAGGFFGVVLIARQADVIVLFEALQPDQLGVVALWLIQLLLLPIAIMWALAWMLGPGFAVGTATTVSPFGTALGPVPTLPLFGTIDPDPQPWWLAIIAVPLLAALAVGVIARRASVPRDASWQDLAVIGASAALISGLGVAGLSALSAGGIGPGRLEHTGPDAWAVGGMAAAVTLVGVVLGLFFGDAKLDGDDEWDDLDDDDLVDIADEQPVEDDAERLGSSASEEVHPESAAVQDELDTQVVEPLPGRRNPTDA